MILVTRLNGDSLAVNADLIQRVEATPDTVVTLVDGSKLVVTESVDTIIDRVRMFRASVVAAAEDLRLGTSPPELRLVGPEDGGK
ncbi:MAG TPA: flagellar FlbD family protein [Acidimicrobiales bacterium]|nr:flagellar FlbD family protein [Acidimicrobiales bacterium]